MSLRTLRTPPRAREAFIAGLARGLSVSGACIAANIGRTTVYEMRASDEVFAAEWNEAIDTGTDVLEDEAFRRACDGVVEPIVSGGRQVMDPDGKPMAIRRYSDSLMVTLLKARRPEKFKDRSSVDAKVAVTAGPASDIADLLKTLSQDERDVLRRIAERQVARIADAEDRGV